MGTMFLRPSRRCLPASLLPIQFAQTFGIDWAGAYYVDTDVARLQICRPGAGKGADGGLGCGVDAVIGETFTGDDGGIEDDRGAVGKERQCLLDGEEEAFYVAC